MFDVLLRAVGEVGEVDPHALADGELCEAAVELARARTMLEAAHARLMVAVDARKAYAPTGARSAATWLASATHAPKNECGRLVWAGRSLRPLPQIADAWRRGEITLSHVRKLAAARTARSAVAFHRDQAELLDAAKNSSFVEFCETLDSWILCNDPDGADERYLAQRERRHVSLDQTVFGVWSGAILLDPVDGLIVHNELDRLERQLFAADWAAAKAELGRDPKLGELARTGDQRRADALVEMATRSAAAGQGPPARPLFSLVFGQDHVRGLCQLDNGTIVPPSALARWRDTALVEAIVFDGDGRAIEVSKRRLFTGVLRRIIEVRDRRCYHPTCDEPAVRCQVDHIEPHAWGGATSQDNGRLACGHHNRQRHHTVRPPPTD